MIRTIRNVVVVAVLAAIVALVAFNMPRKSGGAATGHSHGHGHGSHEGHDHGNGVALSDAKVAAAGIELLKAGPQTLRDTLTLNGMLLPNQEMLLQVTPRFPGVVREVNKRVGDRIEKNDVLAKVESNQSLTVYDLKSSIAGTVIDRQIALGEYVTEQKVAFTVADLSTVWVDFAVNRRDLKRVQTGDKVLVDPSDGDPPLEAAISYLSPVGNADTQSGLARAVLPNADRRFRPGLFVTGRLILSAKSAPIAIRLSALQTIENRTVAFVRDGDKFEVRDVELGERDGEWVEVLFGISEGETYAAKNSFVIKAELAKGSATHEH
jgi:cobalt-zinc-cadmium efflux system membrane fusion protein